METFLLIAGLAAGLCGVWYLLKMSRGRKSHVKEVGVQTLIQLDNSPRSTPRQGSHVSDEEESDDREEPGELLLPSGGLTLIVWTQKWGFSCKVQTATPCGHVLK